jgi:hypothetical protein
MNLRLSTVIKTKLLASNMVFIVSGGKTEAKRPLRSDRHKWEDNIKMRHREIGWNGMD